MGFNYGLEKKNFDSQWAMTRKQYEDAGMSSEAIQAMYDYESKKLQRRPLNRAKNPTRP